MPESMPLAEELKTICDTVFGVDDLPSETPLTEVEPQADKRYDPVWSGSLGFTVDIDGVLHPFYDF